MKKLNYIKNHFQFWVLRVTLFLSVFAFTGYNAKAELPISKSSQSELLLSKKKASKNIISLKKAISHLATVFVFSQQEKFQKVDLKNHQQYLMVKLKAVFQKFIAFKKPIFFFQKRNYPTSSNLDFPIISFL